MADVQTNPDVETIPVTKTVEKTVDDTTEVKEETVTTNGVHTNGDSNGETNGDTNGDASHEEDEKAEVTPKENGVNGDEAAVNGEAETETEAAVPAVADEAAAESATDIAPEEPKEEEPPKVKLHQFPVGKEIPSTSPFCLKVETFLRINKIPYENNRGYKMGKKGKLPWIEYNGERIADSKFIFEYLKDKFEANLDQELTDVEVATGRAVTTMLEESTYWALIYNRYVDNFNEFKKFMAQGPGGIGFNVSQKMFQRKMRSNLDGHGMGRHTKEEVYNIAEGDLRALSAILGEKEYILGDKISSFDCAVFGLCANILYAGMDNPLKEFINESTTNISNLCDKIKESYWSDWDAIIESEKAAEPALKKGFSFRKKKTPKAPKAESAAEGSDDAATTDEAAEEVSSEEKPEEAAASDAPADVADDAEAPTEETPAAETTAAPSEETSEPKETPEVTEETPEVKAEA